MNQYAAVFGNCLLLLKQFYLWKIRFSNVTDRLSVGVFAWCALDFQVIFQEESSKVAIVIIITFG